MSNRFLLSALLTCALCVLASSHLELNAQSNSWADSQTKLTVSDFIKLYCLSHLEFYHQRDQLDISFIPNKSPAEAVLYLVKPVVVPVDDLPTRADLTASLKESARLYEKHVEKIFQDPAIASRWKNVNTRDNLIIRFLSTLDETSKKQETIGLLSRGNLIFEQAKVKEELKTIQKRLKVEN